MDRIRVLNASFLHVRVSNPEICIQCCFLETQWVSANRRNCSPFSFNPTQLIKLSPMFYKSMIWKITKNTTVALWTCNNAIHGRKRRFLLAATNHLLQAIFALIDWRTPNEFSNRFFTRAWYGKFEITHPIDPNTEIPRNNPRNPR